MDSKDFGNQVAETLSNKKIEGSGRRKFIWFLVIAIGVVGYINLKSKKNDMPSIVYETQDVVRGSLTVEVIATGTLEPCNKVIVGSELSGIISDLAVDYNDHIKAGQLLARLDVSRLEAQVSQSKASLEAANARIVQAQATLDQAGAKLEQVEQLNKISEGKVPAQSTLDEVRAGFARAKADLASAKAAKAQVQAALDISETDLEKANIVAPIDGVILSRKVEIGQTVAATFQAPVLFEIAEDLSSLELHVDVDEADIGLVLDGQAAGFTVAAYPNKEFPASITQVRYAPNIIAGVVTYETLMDVDNGQMLLRPGMTATAQIIVNQVDDAILVPSSSLRYIPPKLDGAKETGSVLTSFLPKPPNMDREKEVFISENGNNKVWLLREGSPVEVEVEVGMTDGVFTEILAGDIRPGDKVIIDDMDSDS